MIEYASEMEFYIIFTNITNVLMMEVDSFNLQILVGKVKQVHGHPQWWIWIGFSQSK